MFGINKKTKCAVKIDITKYFNYTKGVKIDNHITNYFNYTKGVRQGCPLSSTLFNLYINEIF